MDANKFTYQELLEENKRLKDQIRSITSNHESLLKDYTLTLDATENRDIKEALLESEKKFRALFENVNAAAALHEIITDENGQPVDFIFLDVNKAYEKITLLKAKEIIGKRGMDVIPNLEKKWIESYGKVALTGKPMTIVDHSDYLDKYWEVKVYSPGEKLFAVLFTDVTEREKTKKELIESKEFAENLISTANTLVIVLDREGKIKVFNEAAEKITGYSREELENKNWFDILIPGENYSDVWNVFSDLTKKRLTRNFENPIHTKNGEERYIMWQNSELIKNGEIHGSVSFGIDITEKKKAEKKHKESKRKLNAVFNAMTEMVVLHDLVFDDKGEVKDYRITDCNKAFSTITGIKKEDAIGKLATDIYKVNPPPYLKEYLEVALTGNPYEFTTFYPPMDKHFMISVISPKKNTFATVTADITTIKQIQEVIISKNKELENYLYVASHDLRSPLVNIQGFSQRLGNLTKEIKELLESDSGKTEKQKIKQILDHEFPRTLDFIHSGVIKMDKLIKGLLLLSRTGRMPMIIGKIDMNLLMSEIQKALKFELEELNGEVKIEQLPGCYGDVDHLNQLFTNIISNAIKYADTTRKLQINISASEKYNQVIYSIRDNGIGISSRHLDRIWDIFFQVNPKKSNSDGLGLSIVKRIVEKHKGKIWVESVEKQGTTFHVELQKKEFSKQV